MKRYLLIGMLVPSICLAQTSDPDRIVDYDSCVTEYNYLVDEYNTQNTEKNQTEDLYVEVFEKAERWLKELKAANKKIKQLQRQLNSRR